MTRKCVYCGVDEESRNSRKCCHQQGHFFVSDSVAKQEADFMKQVDDQSQMFPIARTDMLSNEDMRLECLKLAVQADPKEWVVVADQMLAFVKGQQRTPQ